MNFVCHTARLYYISQHTQSCSCSMPDEDAVQVAEAASVFPLSSSVSFSVFSLLSRSPLASIGVVLLW